DLDLAQPDERAQGDSTGDITQEMVFREDVAHDLACLLAREDLEDGRGGEEGEEDNPVDPEDEGQHVGVPEYLSHGNEPCHPEQDEGSISFASLSMTSLLSG